MPTAAATTSTTLDAYAVPPMIDAAYVNKVLAALDAANGDLVRLYARERRISDEIAARIRALYGSGDGYSFKVGILEGDRDARVAFEPGNRVTTVTRLISASPSCIYAQVNRDYRAVNGNVGIPVQWVGLRATTSPDGPPGYNPTHWLYTVDGFLPDRSQPPNPCSGS